MNFLKLLVILISLQGVSSVAITNEENCDHKGVLVETTDESPLKLSSDFMDILKEFNWPTDESGNIITAASGANELISFCNKLFDLNFINAPKDWQNPSQVTANSAHKIAIRLNACFNSGY